MAVSKSMFVNPDHKHYLYAHLRADNKEVFYIGIGTIQNNKYARAKSKSGRNSYWKNIVNKYGYSIVIFESSNDYDFIKQEEIKYINILGKISNKGCLVNITDGGEGCSGYKHSEEHKSKLKINYSGSKNPMYGKKWTADKKLERSISYSKEGNPRYNKIGKLNPISKQILKIDNLGNIICVYESARQAAKSENISHTSIIKACKNKTNCVNHKWKYDGC